MLKRDVQITVLVPSTLLQRNFMLAVDHGFFLASSRLLHRTVVIIPAYVSRKCLHVEELTKGGVCVNRRAAFLKGFYQQQFQLQDSLTFRVG